jgi:hypothetical protein
MICWICGDIANSEEHKFKASDLRRIHGKNFKELIYSYDGEEHSLKSFKDKLIKFKNVICQKCNNDRTALADKAYDIFVKTLPTSYRPLQGGQFDLRTFYGSDWKKGKVNLYRYLAKHAGCKIATGAFNKIPENLPNFILGNEELNSMILLFYEEPGIGLCKLIAGNDNFTLLANGETIFYKLPDGKSYYHGWITYDWLTIHWICSDSLKTNLNIFNDPLIPVSVHEFDITHRPEGVHLLDWIDHERFKTMDQRIDFILKAADYKE